MKKAFAAVLLFIWLLPSLTLAQGDQLVLRSNAKTFDFQAGDYLKTKWWLQPELDPDTFVLPEYRTEQRVTFDSGIDSLSFVAKPGQTYHVLVQNSKGDRARIAIVAMSSPIFLVGANGLILGIGIVAVGLAAFVKRRAIRPEALLAFGVLAPLSFWILTLVGGYVHGNYNHLTMVVSELGAIGTRSGLFMSVGEALVAVECLLFSVGLYRACEERKINVTPAICTLSMPISMAWAAVFPMRHELHGATGPLPLVLNLGALLAFLLWRRPEVSRLRWMSLVSFGIMGLIFLRFIPGFQVSYPGLVQRLHYLGWTVWSVGLAAGFMRLGASDSHLAGTR